MKTHRRKSLSIILLLILLFILLLGCAKTIYIPLETITTEYKDRIERDSIHLYDSIFVKMNNDTVWLEKYKYMYRDKIVRDSVFINDTIKIPYPVETTIEVNKPTGRQHFLMWCGGILLLVICGYCILKSIRIFILKH